MSEIELGIAELDRFELIGSGGFSTVYAAREVSFGRRVAVKVFHNLDPAGRRQFEREREIMGRLSSHPNVITPFRAGYTDAGAPYLVMEYVGGGSLEDLVRARGMVEWSEAIDFVLPATEALAHAHANGVLHRDVKPANILLADAGPKLTDFGIAAIRETTSSQVAFTLAHCPPETFSDGHDSRDERSDLYSMASTLFQLIVGQAPFDGGPGDSQQAYMFRILQREPPEPPEQKAPESLRRFLRSAMAKDPALRPTSARAFIDQLGRIRTFDTAATIDTVVGQPEPLRRPLPIRPDPVEGPTAATERHRPEETAASGYHRPDEAAAAGYHRPEETAASGYQRREGTAAGYHRPEETAASGYQRREGTAAGYHRVEETGANAFHRSDEVLAELQPVAPAPSPSPWRRLIGSRWALGMAGLVALSLGLLAAVVALRATSGAGDDDASTEDTADEAAAGAETGELTSFGGATVTVVGVEQGESAAAMVDVLDDLGLARDIDISYEEAVDIPGYLNRTLGTDERPDLVIVFQPALVAELADSGFLVAAPADVVAEVEAAWGESWLSYGRTGQGQFGLPASAHVKSLVWYQPARFERLGYDVPQTWTELVELTEEAAAAGDTPWCVGLDSGVDSGWPFTDWVEDLLLRQQPVSVFDDWRDGRLAFDSPEVVGAFETVEQLWSIDGAVAGGRDEITQTGWAAGARSLLDGECLMARQPSFFASQLPNGTALADGSDDAIDVFYLPTDGPDRPVLVGGTWIGVADDRPEVWAVARHLASVDFANARLDRLDEIRAPTAPPIGSLSPMVGVDRERYSTIEQTMLDILDGADVVRFDGSDLMPRAIGSGVFETQALRLIDGEVTASEAAAVIQDARAP